MFDFQIDISDPQDFLAANPGQVRDVISGILREEGVASAELSIALVDDAGIHQVNRQFLQHDHPTDVISFLLSDSARPRLEGELVVSTETAVREAPRHGWTAQDELLLYIVHGMLHLCGYDDLTDEARPIMRDRERQVLAAWKLTPTGLEA